MIRIKLVSASKFAALTVFLLIAVALAVYLSMRGKRIDAPPQHPKLQGRVVAVFNDTRYAHEVEGRIRFLLTAGVDRAFEDGAHELEQVRLESYGTAGTRHDVVTSDRARVSDPSNLNNLHAEFSSNVVVQISDDLTIKTNYLDYNRTKNQIETSERVDFDGKSISGNSKGIRVEAADERIHLLKDADVTLKDEAQGTSGPSLSAGRGPRDESAEAKAARKARKRARRLARKQARALRATVTAKSSGANSKREADGKGLASKKPVHITGESALLERKQRRVTFTGRVIVTQGSDEMRADEMRGYLDDTGHLERVEARGSSYLRQGDRAEFRSADIDFFFAATHQLERAVATGEAFARALDSESPREARAAKIEASFVDSPQGNAVDTITGIGGAVVLVPAPAASDQHANPAARELRANEVTLHFHPGGRFIKSAEAAGDAAIVVTPLRAEGRADKKTIRAPQMNAEFFETGNQLKSFNAAGGVRVELESLVAEAHPLRVTTSKRLTASFAADVQDVERIVQEGDFKYAEGDRHAIAERAVYDGRNEMLLLRGKRPQAWDSKARTQADEIDHDRRNDETHARGDVRTTYYSRETTDDSTPFKNTKSPVFMTADRADARNGDGVAVYTGNARGWQDDSFVKGDRIELYRTDKRMAATGNVESALYTLKRKTPEGRQEIVPTFATAERMTYSDTDRLVHYEGRVRARQGEDTIDASSLDVFLQKETNEVERMLATGGVVLTQPGRRGTGDTLSYTAADGRAVLTGNNARVDDAEKGSSMGAQLTFYIRDDRFVVDNQQGLSRVRSTHRLKKK
ncbi:MAG TPA: LPS export ABC transporter periplasmic protein LptC [Blastocatellia bacterium]|nr:LPS export ABC transporter periplasmic protein LptC [Blastocatellia bacterium]